MKKFLIIGGLLCLLIFVMSSCAGRSEEGKSSIAYGQVVKTDEKTITVESGKYKYSGKFKGSGEEVSYILPENVFFDDFKKGDIVAILFDGNDVVAVTDVNDSDRGTETGGEKTLRQVDSMISADGEEKVLLDKEYALGDDGKTALLALNGGKLELSGVKVKTKGKSSPGVRVLNDGAAECAQLDIRTAGGESPAVETADSSGSMNVYDSDFQTSGKDSPGVFSSGNISLDNVTGDSEAASALALNRGGVVNLKNCSMVSGGESLMDIFYDKEKEKLSATAKCTVDNSSLRGSGNKSLIRVSGADSVVKMLGSSIFSDSGVLAEVEKDGDRGGKLLLSGANQAFIGNIKCDEKSKVKLILMENSTFKGSFDPENTAGYSKVYLSSDSSWELTGNSYAGSFINEDELCGNIKSNGYNVYYDKDNLANDWLEGRTIELSGGGRIIPLEK